MVLKIWNEHKKGIAKRTHTKIKILQQIHLSIHNNGIRIHLPEVFAYLPNLRENLSTKISTIVQAKLQQRGFNNITKRGIVKSRAVDFQTPKMRVRRH